MNTMEFAQQHEIRAWFNQIKENLICNDCGFEFKGRPECCDFHHTDPKTKLGNVGRMVNFGAGKNSIQAEIDKCLPLCVNCHRTLHFGKKQ